MSTGESRSIPLSSATERWAVFGPPPLLGDEKDSDYQELFARIYEAVKPADILEEIWICDIADNTWDIGHLAVAASESESN
jgi:hypothetical protein